MTVRQSRTDAGMGACCIASAVIHVAVFLLLTWYSRLLPPQMAMQETYYVDVVTLPVASPRSGSPTQRGDEAEAPPPSPKSSMTVPALPPAKVAAPLPTTHKTADKVPTVVPKVKESDEFAERMAKLEGKAESRHQEAVLDRLRQKVATTGNGRSGTPTGSGSEAGSDYSAYIQSRLKDAFRETISYTSSKPEVVIRLVIGSDGSVSRKKIERSSGDRTFEQATLRAIDIASVKFPPPPDRKVYEGVFVFRPQGISNNKP